MTNSPNKPNPHSETQVPQRERELRRFGITAAMGKWTDTEGQIQAAAVPLLEKEPKRPKTAGQKAMRKSFKGTAHLSNLLPTGSVLTFQLLSPIFTHLGQCPTITSHYMTLTLLLLCGLSCFFISFTDSVRDERGKVRYGVATPQGLWVIDGSMKLPPEEAAKYRLRRIDFAHAILSIFVFAALALLNTHVVSCFFPEPTEEEKEIIGAVPVVFGVVTSVLFLVFPTKRHGIGYPLSRN